MELSAKFVNGLKDKHNMTPEDIQNWIYCGGNFKQHYRYFKLCFPAIDGVETMFPDLPGECICKTKIDNSCFIRPNINSPAKDILIVGACCIEKFLPNGFTRFCERCNIEHKRRITNICSKCETLSFKEENWRNSNLSEETKKDGDAYAVAMDASPYVYFDFSYSMKDEIKRNGAKWDSDNELWYVRRIYKPEFIQDYAEFIITDVDAFIAERTRKKEQQRADLVLFSEGKYICKYFKFDDKDKAKAEGYQWDNTIRKWWKAIRPDNLLPLCDASPLRA